MPRAWTEEQRRARQQRFKRVVRERRQALLEELGPMCQKCGDTDPDNLQFDHEGGWKPSPVKKKNQRTRITELWRDYIAWREFREGGPLRVLCARCNGWDGSYRQRQKRAEERLARRRLERRKKGRKR